MPGPRNAPIDEVAGFIRGNAFVAGSEVVCGSEIRE